MLMATAKRGIEFDAVKYSLVEFMVFLEKYQELSPSTPK